MANGTPNTGNNPAGNVDPKQLTATLKELRQGQGDFQDAIRDSVRELNKVVSSYERIEGTLGALKTSTLNISKIEKELEKAKAKQIVQTNKLKELEDKIGQEGKTRAENLVKSQEYLKKLESDVYKARATGNKQQLAISTNLLATAERYVDQLKQTINPQEAAYAAQLKSLDISDQQVKLAEDYLESEKEVSKAVGNTGKVLGFTSKYLGIGKDLYGKIVEEAREGEFATKKMVTAGGALAAVLLTAYKGMKSLVNAAKDGLDALTSSGGPVSKFFSPFTNLIKQIPLVGGLLGGLVDAFANLADFAVDSSSKVENFARNLGISYQEAKRINLEFASFAINSGKAFLNIEKLQNSQIELSKSLGVNTILNNQILSDNIQLQEQVGLELETRKQLAEVTLISGKYQTQIFKTIVGQVEALRRSVGVNLRAQDVIANISKLTGVVGLTFAKYPEKLAKSLAITKALGIDFQKLDSIASGLLDFESSIASEFEAQLLTGKDINLQKARQLALDNDLTGLAVELNQQLGSSTDFLNMNRFAQESIAAAFKMSRDELADMLRQQEMFAAAGATDLKTFKDRIAQMERAGTLQSEFLGKLSEEQAQYFLSSTATEKIANFMEKIRQSFAQLLSSDQFKAFLDTFLNKLSDPNFLTGIINKISSFVSLLLKAIAGVVDVIDSIGNVVGLGGLLFKSIPNSVPQGIRAIAESIDAQSISSIPSTISVGSNVASSQIKSTSYSDGIGSAKQQTPITNIINVPKSIVEDHTVSLAARIGKSGERDMVTGIIS